MLPGPTLIRKCSACEKLIAQPTIASGNTFGARFWTDGKSDAPMLPDEPWLVKCPHCGALVWIDEQEQVGEVGQRDNGGGTFKNALPYDTPSMQDYLGILEKESSDNEKIRYIRLRAWWAGNDIRREGEDPAPLSDDEIANLFAFATLLDESDEDDRIMKAEVMRELGNYEDAMALLSKPFSDEVAQAVDIIKALTAREIPFVSEMKIE